MANFLSKLLSLGADRELKEYERIAAQVNALEPTYQAMSDEELHAVTAAFRERYAAGETLEKDLSALRRTYNRGGYTKGYLFGQDKNLLSPRVQGHMGERIGRVERISKNDNSAFVRSAYFPAKGDGFKILRAGEEVGGCEYRAERAAEKGGFYLHRIPDLRIGDDVYFAAEDIAAATGKTAAQDQKAPAKK